MFLIQPPSVICSALWIYANTKLGQVDPLSLTTNGWMDVHEVH